MNIALVGCGFVAAMYVRTLQMHPDLKLLGVHDRDAERAQRMATHCRVRMYPTLDALLADPEVDIVVNLTNPHSHYTVSHAALLANKHVYSEKPLAMDLEQARRLVTLAASRGLHLSAAPCSVLSETAQTLWKAVREQRVGPIHLAYAEMDDGALHRMAYRSWTSDLGAPWPYRDEFEVGCTMEHAGYSVSWLAAMFGPAITVTAHSALTVPDKSAGETIGCAPDFSVAVIRFASGTVARLTCSIVAPHDHGITLFGAGGTLRVKDCWFYQAPVHEQKWLRLRGRTRLNPWPRALRLAGRKVLPRLARGPSAQMDFLRGVTELADALREGRSSRLSPEFSLHITELALAIQNARDGAPPYRMTSQFEPMAPMPWASGNKPGPVAVHASGRPARLRFGIAGCGYVAHAFAADLAAHVDAEAVAVYSRGATGAQAFAAQYGIARVHASLEALCADHGVDVIYVATPPALHHAHARAALLAGKPVLCEKPFALNAEQAADLAALARTRGLFCMEAMWTRFMPGMARIRECVHNGSIGEARLLNVDFSTPVAARDGHFLFDRDGGGAILDRLVYGIAIAQDLWGAPQQVQALILRDPRGVDQSACAILNWAGGQMATLSASIGAYGGNEIVVAGSHGRIRSSEPVCRPERLSVQALQPSPPARGARAAPGRLARLKRSLWLRRALFPAKKARETLREEDRPVHGEGYSHEISEVVRCLRAGLLESPAMPLQATLDILQVVDEIRRQADDERAIERWLRTAAPASPQPIPQ